jgi:NAD(P)-dependent dehydrogenase (short-subunit alcohol dehydrogenase family)
VPVDLEGRVALVTGASSGIGRGTALMLAARGARVLAVARSKERLAILKAEHQEIDVAATSLIEPDGCSRVVEKARELGPVTILVHAAGLGGYLGRPIWEETLEAWRATMALNLDAAFELTRLVVPDMISAGWGRIVMIGSTAGQVGAPAMSAYSASKAGLLGLMRSVAQDIGQFGITANAVVPGWVSGTEMAERDAEQDARRRGMSVEAVWAERAASYPAGRVLSSDEIVRVISFLASDAASGISGEGITVALGGNW